MSENSQNREAVISQRLGISPVWVVPLIALIIGAWMVVQHYLSRGPEISITFKVADGIEEGKTKIKSLSVDVGIVESVHLNDDFKSVTVNARIDQEASSLLRADSKFWVVRPRIAASGVSGIGTLLSGAYIELSPGKKEKTAHSFKGLDDIPVTPVGVPGLHVTLLSDVAGSLSTGDPIIFRGYQVGQIESAKLDIDTKKLQAKIFIESPYDKLVSSKTRFWNASGISLEASAQGFSVETGTLQSIVLGGVAFDLPDNTAPGDPVENHAEFKVYPNKKSINEIEYQERIEYLLLFERSVKGLEAGSQVLYRGMHVGNVVDVSFNYLDEKVRRGQNYPLDVPVLIHVEPGRWLGVDTEEAKQEVIRDMEEAVKEGLRGTIKSGNLLTGAQIISFDFYKNATPGYISQTGKYTTLPVIETGLEDIQAKVSALLDKLNELPLNSTLTHIESALDQTSTTMHTLNQAVENLNELLQQQDTQQLSSSINDAIKELNVVLKGLSPDSSLYSNLNHSIEQLNNTLKNIESFTYKLEKRPNSLIFSEPVEEDKEPKAYRK